MRVQELKEFFNYHTARKNGEQYYNKHLVDSIIKYGFNNFIIDEELDTAYSQEELNNKEKYWIDYYKSYDKKYGYNKNLGGEGSRATEETKKKMRLNHPDVSGEKNPMYGKKGKLSTCYGRNGKIHPMFGKTGGDSPMSMQIICLNTSEIFPSSKEASEHYNYNRDGIRQACSLRISAGVHPQTGEKMAWMYYDKYLESNESDIIEKLLKATNSKNSKPRKVINLNTNEIFNTVTAASNQFKTSASNISNCCKGRVKSAGKHPITGEKLTWMYYDEYIKLQNAVV